MQIPENIVVPLAIAALAVMSAGSLLAIQSAVTAPLDIRNVPIFLDQTVAPINMLVVGRDHKLYYEAYNDASDLNGDGILDVGFRPNITYFGYFDSGTCYDYGTSLANTFTPSGPAAAANTCSGKWSGNWLNYVTTARIDALRKVLYGGKRLTDTATQTGPRATTASRSTATTSPNTRRCRSRTRASGTCSRTPPWPVT